MNYKIIDVDILDQNISMGIDRLLGQEFWNNPHKMSQNKLKDNTTTKGRNKSLYLAAIENEEIIGFTAFISHNVFLNNKTINCYQMCWAAISSKHQRKKIFQNIIEEAKKILKDRDAGFMFGFPNEKSHPIFIHRLGFKELASVKLNIPNVPFVKNFFLSHKINDINYLKKNSFLQNETELYKLKEAEYGRNLIKVEINGSIIWGTYRNKILKGIKLSFFDIGGIQIQRIEDITLLFNQLSKKQKFSFFQFVSVKNNSYNQIFKRLIPARTNNLIYYDLNIDTSSYNFNFFGGIKDVW